MKHYFKNPRQITQKQIKDLEYSLLKFGDLSGIVHDLNSDEIIGGNQRMEIFGLSRGIIDENIRLDETYETPDAQGTVGRGKILWKGFEYTYRQVKWDPRMCEEANIRANYNGGSTDYDILANQWDEQDLLSWGFDEFHFELPTEKKDPEEARATLAERFIVPPFSVLDARQGYWQDRKRAWWNTGIKSEEGRDTNLIGASDLPEYARNGTKHIAPDTSDMDPVLCELSYRWFCPPGGLVINPTAGESVYGLVASYLGYRYKGVELRPEQIEANRKQNQDMKLSAEWIQGDGQNIYDLVGEDADFIMCCPPYADLEVYSKDPRDLSNMPYDEFVKIYRQIIQESIRRLKDNRFACFTVGDIRDKKGIYRNFVSETIRAFLDAGCHLYNEAVLITQVGSMALVTPRFFISSRKLGKTHQNVLIFVKGDWREAVKACGDIEVYFPEEDGDAE